MFLAVPTLAASAAEDPSALLQAGRKAVAAKDCAAAVKSFQAAADLAEKASPSPAQKATVQQEALREIAECHTAASNWDAAETALWRRKEALAHWTGPRELELGQLVPGHLLHRGIAAAQLGQAAWIQPPRIVHAVLGYSDDCEVLEIVLPAEFETVEV